MFIFNSLQIAAYEQEIPRGHTCVWYTISFQFLIVVVWLNIILFGRQHYTRVQALFFNRAMNTATTSPWLVISSLQDRGRAKQARSHSAAEHRVALKDLWCKSLQFKGYTQAFPQLWITTQPYVIKRIIGRCCSLSVLSGQKPTTRLLKPDHPPTALTPVREDDKNTHFITPRFSIGMRPIPQPSEL